jgi:hypothetical protein
MKFPILAALAVAGLSAMVPLGAQPPEGGRGRMLPANRAEVEQMVTQRFQARDANRDGFLSGDELGERGAMMLERQDADRDGKISIAEAAGSALAMFDRADADRNGTISDSERQAAMAAMGGPRGRGGGGGLGNLPSTRAGMTQMGRQVFATQDVDHDGFLTAAELGERAPAALARLDADHDGKISAAESGNGFLVLFDRVDTDHDGTISDAERAAARAAMTPPPQPTPSGS